ncbi:hypothetical protein [Wukongibacter baidiensis]
MLSKKRVVFLIILLAIFISSSINAFAIDDGANIGERILMGIINSSSEGMNSIGISIDNLVYGEPQSNGEKSPIIFDLKTDNVMARITIDMYKLFRAIAVILMFTVGTIMAIKVMLKGTGLIKASAKEMLAMYCISFILIFAMPYIIDFALYFKDKLIIMIKSSSPTGKNFIESLRMNALADNAQIFDTLLYLAGVVLSLWFAFVYTGIGMTLAALLIFFPIFSLFMNGEKTKFIIGNWIKEVVSLVFIPVIDAVILLIPLGILDLDGMEEYKQMLYTIFSLAYVMPLRTMIRRIVGVGGSTGELAGIGFMMGATKLFTGAVKGATGLASEGYKGYQDLQTSKYYDEVSKPNDSGSKGSSGNLPATTNNRALAKTSDLDSLKMNNFMPGGNKNNKAPLQGKVKKSPIEEKYSKQYGNESWLNNIDMPLTDKEKGRLYKRRGRKRIAMAIGKAGGSVAGAAGGAVMFSGLGASGMVNGARIMGSAGGAAGQAAGFGAIWLDERSNNTSQQSRGNKSGVKVEADVKTKPLEGEVSSTSGGGVPAVYENAGSSGYQSHPQLNSPAIEGKTLDDMAQEISDVVTSDIPSEVEVEINKKSNMAKEKYIENYKNSGELKARADEAYNSQISSMANRGIEITPEMEVTVRQNAERQANQTMYSNAEAQKGYVTMQNNKAYYEKELASRGYDSGTISRVSHLLEQKINERFSGYDLMDDIDISNDL